ncbi:MAG: Hpt domain-containing protein [Phycisphaerales bacterium JB040]
MSDRTDIQPLLSCYADDPEMGELISEFLESLPGRVRALRGGLEQRDVKRLTRIAHQLKGASAGYGFAPIGESAAHLEDTLRAFGQRDLSGVSALIEDLIGLCNHAVASAEHHAH